MSRICLLPALVNERIHSTRDSGSRVWRLVARVTVLSRRSLCWQSLHNATPNSGRRCTLPRQKNDKANPA